MYWESFGFKEPPFALTPNPAFLFLSTPHQEAFAHLLFAIENRSGFIELSGEVGTGKTTLVRTLLNHLEPATYRTALIFNPILSPLGFLKEVNREFGVSSDGAEMRDLLQALNEFLLEENRAGRTVVLVIDEAQNLAVDVLEHVRLISNLETESDKLIQIVLVGQPELNGLLARPDLRQLDQRITVRYHLTSMGFADSGDYIRHRIRFAADGREPLIFSKGAVRKIFAYSKGLPRLINGICDRALLLAFTKEAKVVSPSMAALAIADMRREGASRKPWLMAAASALVAILAVAAFLAYPRGTVVEAKKISPTLPSPVGGGPGRGETATPEVVPASVTAVSFSRDAALKSLAAASEQDDVRAALNAVLAAWQKPPVQPVPGQSTTVKGVARQRGLIATKMTANLQTLQLLDTPALLTVAVPGAGSRVVALVAIDKEGAGVVPAIAGRSKLTPAELALVWNGEATILWKDFHRLSSRTTAADKAEGARLLQGLLKEAGCFNGQVTTVAGRKTQAAVAEFQRRERLKVDGQATAETLLLLYRRAGGFFPPGITARHPS